MLVVGEWLSGFAPAMARTERSAEAPAPLPVRYKVEAAAKPDDGPFALLAAFPKVVSRHPGADRPRIAFRVRKERASLIHAGRTPLPPRTGSVSSGFGMRRHPLLGGWRPHRGIDLAAPTGTPVHATADGVVRASGRRGGYGLSIALEHGQGSETRYAHMSRLNVTRGQRVRRGNVIGWVGSTGLSTGPHLHYETLVQGKPVNPLPRRKRQ